MCYNIYFSIFLFLAEMGSYFLKMLSSHDLLVKNGNFSNMGSFLDYVWLNRILCLEPINSVGTSQIHFVKMYYVSTVHILRTPPHPQKTLAFEKAWWKYIYKAKKSIIFRVSTSALPFPLHSQCISHNLQ